MQYDHNEDYDNMLSGVQETMKTLFKAVEDNDFKEVIIQVNCYYEGCKDTPSITHTADISMATIFQWYDEYLKTLVYLDDIDFDVIIK